MNLPVSFNGQLTPATSLAGVSILGYWDRFFRLKLAGDPAGLFLYDATIREEN